MATLRPESTCPAEVLDWIAWYGEPDLPPEIRSAIDRHAAECLGCRKELAQVSGEAEADGDVPDGDRTLERVLRRTRASQTPSAGPGTDRGPRASLHRRLKAQLAAAAALLLLAGGAWFATDITAGPQPLRTATAATPGVGDRPALEVIFRDDVAWAQVRELLAELGAEMGPSPAASTTGRVRLALARGVDPHAALGAVRESGLSVFAEPAGR
ncbi:MAG: hypothetical protein CL910_09670 [Deltaproteobacteria bacterium]|jgi:hypothetical protein|nr:hypothetical protein [Deltaproteobacteria bacterium]